MFAKPRATEGKGLGLGLGVGLKNPVQQQSKCGQDKQGASFIAHESRSHDSGACH